MDALRPNRMLVILAHPNDERFAVGETLAKYADQGIQVVLLAATRGEEGIPGAKPDLLRAAERQGIEVHYLDYPQEELSAVDLGRLLEHIACWIDTVQPQVVLTCGPDGISGLPDHVAISRVVTQIVEQYFPEICLLYLAPTKARELGYRVAHSIGTARELMECFVKQEPE